MTGIESRAVTPLDLRLHLHTRTDQRPHVGEQKIGYSIFEMKRWYTCH